MMLEELQRLNYAETTISSYIRIVEDFSRRFQRSPDRLGPQHIREYQAELFKKRKLAASTVTVYLAALRFFYTKTLKKSWSAAETPYPKRAEHIPSILSQQEVARLIDAADNSFHRTLLMTLSATGVRRAELTHTDGPYVETNEHIGGFWVPDAADLDEPLTARLPSAVGRRSRYASLTDGGPDGSKETMFVCRTGGVPQTDGVARKMNGSAYKTFLFNDLAAVVCGISRARRI
jgi:hypothetical protein